MLSTEGPAAITAGAVTGWQSRWGFEVVSRFYITGGQRVVVLEHGNITPDDAPLVRIHSACITSESLGSTRCDCREQLDAAMRLIGDEGKGLLFYFPDHEGRGIGLEDKLMAYALQDEGHDTTQANILLGHPVDDRNFEPAAQLLTSFGISRVRLLTNNPLKIDALIGSGIEVERAPLWVEVSQNAEGYLSHKRSAMAHLD